MSDSFKRKGISVIASFSKTGKVMPIYFRGYDDDDSFPVRVEVKSSDKDFWKITFNCTYQQEDIRREIKLYYWFKETIWTLD